MKLRCVPRYVTDVSFGPTLTAWRSAAYRSNFPSISLSGHSSVKLCGRTGDTFRVTLVPRKKKRKKRRKKQQFYTEKKNTRVSRISSLFSMFRSLFFFPNARGGERSSERRSRANEREIKSRASRFPEIRPNVLLSPENLTSYYRRRYAYTFYFWESSFSTDVARSSSVARYSRERGSLRGELFFFFFFGRRTARALERSKVAK